MITPIAMVTREVDPDVNAAVCDSTALWISANKVVKLISGRKILLPPCRVDSERCADVVFKHTFPSKQQQSSESSAAEIGSVNMQEAETEARRADRDA